MPAPLIKPIRQQGGTFYTFSSAQEDLNYTFVGEQKKFAFSNFALLNIPDLVSPMIDATNTVLQNKMQLDAIPGAFAQDPTKSMNVRFAESFQNYCLNAETLITQSDNYNIEERRTVSERVFFKWLKETGAMRFRESNLSERSTSALGEHFVEEDNSEYYERVVKYIGEIDVVNSVKHQKNAYSEVYVYVPTQHGGQPTIQFTATQDANYGVNMEFTNNPSNPLDSEYLTGRSYNTQHPVGMSITAHFDSDNNTFLTSDYYGNVCTLQSYDIITNTWKNGFDSLTNSPEPGFTWWYPVPKANTYFTERNYFADPRNDRFRILSSNGNYTEFLRSRLDGITLQYNTRAYKDFESNASINSFGQYAETSFANNFEFNCVLVYYSLQNQDDTDTSVVNNLFGVLFLDNVENLQTGGGKINRLQKYKPNPLTGDNGNAYGFSIALKFDTNSQDAAVETIINEYNKFSLDLFTDTMNELREISRLFLSNHTQYTNLKGKVDELEGLLINDSQKEEILSQLSSINSTLSEIGMIDANYENLLALIQRNYEEILNIYANNTSIEVAYNLGVIQEGDGISIENENNQRVIIASKNQEFNILGNPRKTLTNDFTQSPTNYTYIHNLQKYSNYIRFHDTSLIDEYSPYIVDKDIFIKINDGTNKWKLGQTLTITFNGGWDLSNTNGNFNLYLFTDSTDQLNNGYIYGAEIGVITYNDFDNHSNKPNIQIVCIDADTLVFDINIF